MNHDYSKVPQSVKDLLQDIDGMNANINYKQILKNAIKKTVSCQDRSSTWKRPNKRYGVYSPGTKLGNLPQLDFYIDTSGSISYKELSSFLNIMNEFLKVGVRTCDLFLWHTSVYKHKKHKKNNPFKENEVEAGGTDISEAMASIKKRRPDLAIILTDGYYEMPNVAIDSQVIFIISEGGNMNHPLAKIGKTIGFGGLK